MGKFQTELIRSDSLRVPSHIREESQPSSSFSHTITVARLPKL